MEKLVHPQSDACSQYSPKKWLVLISLATLTGCGSGSNSSSNEYPLMVNVNGLEGGSVVLINENSIDRDGDKLTINKNGTFQFGTLLSEGAQYLVRVKSQPDKQICTVSNGAGIASPDMLAVNITCYAPDNLYSIKGVLTGLSDNHYVVLSNNATDVLTLPANGEFQFPQLLPRGSHYQIAIETNSQGQDCVLTNAEGVASPDMPKSSSAVVSFKRHLRSVEW